MCDTCQYECQSVLVYCAHCNSSDRDSFSTPQAERDDIAAAQNNCTLIWCIIIFWYGLMTGVAYGFGTSSTHATGHGYDTSSILLTGIILGLGIVVCIPMMCCGIEIGCSIIKAVCNYECCPARNGDVFHSKVMFAWVMVWSMGVVGTSIPLLMGSQIKFYANSLGDPLLVTDITEIHGLPRSRPFSDSDGSCEDQTRLFIHQRIKFLSGGDDLPATGVQLLSGYEFVHEYPTGPKKQIQKWMLAPLISPRTRNNLTTINEMVDQARMNASDTVIPYEMLVWVTNYGRWYQRPSDTPPPLVSTLIPLPRDSNQLIFHFSHLAKDSDEIFLAAEPPEFNFPNVLKHRNRLIVLDGRDLDGEADRLLLIGAWANGIWLGLGLVWTIAIIRWRVGGRPQPVVRPPEPPAPAPPASEKQFSGSSTSTTAMTTAGGGGGGVAGGSGVGAAAGPAASPRAIEIMVAHRTDPGQSSPPGGIALVQLPVPHHHQSSGGDIHPNAQPPPDPNAQPPSSVAASAVSSH